MPLLPYRLVLRWGLRLRLVCIVVLASLTTGAILSWMLIQSSRQALRQSVYEGNLAAADIAAEFASQYIAGTQVVVEELAGRADVVAAVLQDNPEVLRPQLVHTLSTNPRLDGVSFVDVQGFTRVFGVATSASSGASSSDRDWYREAMSTGKPALGLPTRSRSTGNAIVPYGVPILNDQGQPQGVMIGAISIARLSDAITRIGADRATRASIWDLRGEGISLINQDPQQVLLPIRPDTATGRAALAGERGYRESERNGIALLDAFTPVPGLPWAMLIRQPSTVVFAPVDEAIQRAVGLMFVAMLALAPLGGLLAFQVTRPLVRLRQTATEFAAGDFSHRVELTTRDEVGDLGRTFDHMADMLVERTAALESLIGDLARVASIVQASEDAIISHDLDGVITTWNPGATHLYGYSAEEALGQPLTLLAPPGYMEEHVSFIESIQQGEAVGPVETKRLRQDGSIVDVSMTLAPIFDSDHAVLGGATIARDISSRVRTEAALAQQTRELESAVKELEAFSYTVSHDLRAPIRAMDGFSRILVEEHSAELSAEAQRYLGLVRSNATRMGDLVDDLLAFSRLSRQPLEKQLVNPGRIAHEVSEDLAGKENGWPADLCIGDLPPCWADPSLLRQVYANLLENAVKFTAKQPTAMIEVGSRTEDGEVVYFVKDNGAGFDMRYADKLFGVFQRLHRATDFEGTGVGLAIVQRIIHRHGGRIWADAQVGHGATFSFTLGASNGTR